MAELHRQSREVLYEEQRAVYTSNHEKYSRLGGGGALLRGLRRRARPAQRRTLGGKLLAIFCSSPAKLQYGIFSRGSRLVFVVRWRGCASSSSSSA